MSVVNFIADPWEWPLDRKLEIGERFWTRHYTEFKFRLHWLLLWHSEVHVLDTFVLSNRQLEQWFLKAHNDPRQKEALEKLFRQDRALRISLRTGSNLTSLCEIDNSQVRGNKEFIWYPDGKPEESYITLLDEYLKLPDNAYSPTYSLERHSQTFLNAFDAAFHRTNRREELYTEFRKLRDTIPSKTEALIRTILANQGRRSLFYTVLGYGMTENGKLLSPTIKLPPEARNELRRLADRCYYQAINHDIGEASRFPGRKPPFGEEMLYDASEAGRILHYDEQVEWVQKELTRRDVGAAYLVGDVELLLQEFEKLELNEIYDLRNLSSFREYRLLYQDFQTNEPAAFQDLKLLKKIAEQVVKCLSEIGKKCGVKINLINGSPALVKFVCWPPSKYLISYGLGIYFPVSGSAPVKLTESLTGAVAREVLGKFAQMLTIATFRVGFPQKPLRIRAEYQAVKTSHQ